MFEFKPDYEKTRQRIEAFWEFDVLDCPVVYFFLKKPLEQQTPLPVSHHATPAERWLDAEYQAELALANIRNRDFVGDDLPIVYPNLGPDIFSAFYGCPLHFGDYGTSWSDPILHDWANMLDSPWLVKLHEMTVALLEAGKDKFIVGMTDWHPGGDALAVHKGIQVGCTIDELPHVMETLSPRGLYLVVNGVTSHSEAESILKRIETWTAQKAHVGQA
jgi:hypothetical protein